LQARSIGTQGLDKSLSKKTILGQTFVRKLEAHSNKR